LGHASRTLVLDGEQEIGYDHLIIAAGGAANYFDIPGAAESTPLHPLARPWEYGTGYSPNSKRP